MTETQGDELIRQSAIASQYCQDVSMTAHVLSGETQFLAHVVVGICFALVFFGLVVCSQLRRF